MTRVGTTIGAVYELLSPSGERAVLNDPADPDFVGYLTGDDAVTGLERASVRESADVLPEADGGVHGAFRYGRLEFTLKGMLDGDTPPFHDSQDKLLAATDAMLANGRLRWTANGVPLQLMFRQQQPTRITGRIPKTFVIAGVADRNTITSELEKADDALAAATVGGGFSSPLVSPLVSAPSTDGAVDVENEGRARSWPILEVYGPCTNPVLTNLTDGGKAIRLIYTLAADERLVIDTDPRRRSIKLNDQANRYGALDFARSEWWALLPGVNAIRVAFNTYGAGAKLRVRWRDTWG